MGNREKALAAIVLVAIASGVGGWFFGQSVKSPEQIAAEIAPPPKSRITVPVEARELSDDIVTRISVSFDDTAGINVPQNVSSQFSPVVTGRVPERNTVMDSGTVLVEVNERPFFVLEGELPASRTIRAGTSGPDVKQLEEALGGLGYFSATPDNTFDEDTKAAITMLYETEGYTPPPATEAEADELEQAEEAVTLAEEAVADAKEALTEAGRTETESQRLSRILGWENTQQAWADQQRAAQNWQDNDPDIQIAKQTVVANEEIYNEAIKRTNQARTLVHPDTGEVPTVDEIDAFVAVSNEAAKGVNEARAELARAIAESDADDDAAKLLEQQRRQFEIDTVRYRETLNDLVPDTSFQQEALEMREKDLATAQETLDEVVERSGAYLPDHEFTFLSNLPRNISSVAIERGDFIRTGVPIVQVAGDTLLVDGAVSENQRPELDNGQRIVIDDPNLSEPVEGVFTRLDEVKDGSSKYPGRYYFRADLAGEYDIDELVAIGNLRTVIPIGRSEGEVLAVPRNALRTTFEDLVQVLVEREDGSTEFVDVLLGLQPDLGGYVEVTPVNSGDLTLGDQVVIQDPNEDASIASTNADANGTQVDTNGTEVDTDADDTNADDTNADDTDEPGADTGDSEDNEG